MPCRHFDSEGKFYYNVHTAQSENLADNKALTTAFDVTIAAMGPYVTWAALPANIGRSEDLGGERSRMPETAAGVRTSRPAANHGTHKKQ